MIVSLKGGENEHIFCKSAQVKKKRSGKVVFNFSAVALLRGSCYYLLCSFLITSNSSCSALVLTLSCFYSHWLTPGDPSLKESLGIPKTNKGFPKV